MSEDCQKCGTAMHELDEDRLCPGCGNRDLSDLDRVIAERDAALEEVEALKHWRDLALQFDNHRMQALGHLKAIVRCSDRDLIVSAEKFLFEPPIPAGALQQRLTAADERADVLGGQLAESERKRLEFVDAVKVETDLIEANHSSCVMVPEGYAVVPIKPTKAMREACQIAGKLPVWDAMMAAALKPAEGGGDENL